MSQGVWLMTYSVDLVHPFRFKRMAHGSNDFFSIFSSSCVLNDNLLNVLIHKQNYPMYVYVINDFVYRSITLAVNKRM